MVPLFVYLRNTIFAQQMILQKTTLPDLSILKSTEDTFSYIDSFQSVVSDRENKRDIISIMKLFSSSTSGWVSSLMKLRDKIVQPFGLKTSKDIEKQSVDYEIGSQHGIFKIFDKTDNEIVLGEDDTHLNFRVSLLLESDNTNKKISITTAVKFNNLFGKLYFLPVKPFHKLIVKGCLRNIIRQIENE